MTWQPTPPDQIPTPDALLALLPDNTTEDIGAADLRTITQALASVDAHHVAMIGGGHIGPTLGRLPLTVGQLRALDIDTAYPVPQDARATDPTDPTRTTLIADPIPLGLRPLPWLEDAYLVRITPLHTLLYARVFTGTPDVESTTYLMTIEAQTPDTELVGAHPSARFHSESSEILNLLGPITGLGHDVAAELVGLETRLSGLEHVSQHAPSIAQLAPDEHITGGKNPGGFVEFSYPADIFDGQEHTVVLSWGSGTAPTLGDAIPYTFAHGPRDTPYAKSQPIVDLAGHAIPAATAAKWVADQAHLVFRWDSAAGTAGALVFAGAKHQAAAPPPIVAAEVLEDRLLTVADLRGLDVGKTYMIPAHDQETTPGSGVTIPVSDLSVAAITDRGHPIINAVLIRTGTQTWTLIGEEWTGTAHQPVVHWILDLEPAWPDNTGIGGTPGTTFSNLVFELRTEIGDPSVFGAETITSQIQKLEHAIDDVSRRLATFEAAGSGGHLHTDIAADLIISMENNGEHFCIVADDPSLPDHIGIDLLDGAEHKIGLKWKAGFDPAHYEHPAGTWIDWTRTPPSVWFQSERVFKRIIDPATGAVISFAAIQAFVAGASVLTVKWNTAPEQLEILKVEHGSVHA